MPMVIVVVQSIADDEAIGDLEAVVVGLDVDLGLASLPKKDCRPNAAWAVAPNRRQQCGQSVTRVKNVVDQKDRAIVDIRQQGIVDAQFERFRGGTSVTGSLNQTDAQRQVDGADQV